jgi:glutaredoxin-related protein
LEREGRMSEVIPQGYIVESLESRLKKLINQDKIMLFIKGPASSPYCGFSQRIVRVLNKYDGVKFGSFDILIDE